MNPKDRDESAAVCLTCAAPIPTAAPFGLCPTCLIGLARDVDGPAPSDRRRFGDYEVLDEVARGGMGVVFRATQRSLRRDVALKLMIGGELSSPAARRMFQTEALAAAALHHPHIVPVYDSGECELQPFIAMRFVAGGRNVAHWATPLREGRQWREIAATMAQVARAVCHAHDRGVLHRDLKPSNILWDAEAGPQVADFGLAKIIDAGSTDGVALSARMLGSPGYMAPELAGGGNDEVTVATDVYGLGAVLYELLSGRPPFQGKSALETTRMVREEAPPPLRDVPKDIATICMKCLARVPGDRYASATALAEDLERFVRGEPVVALPVPAGVRVWRWAKRKPAVAASLFVAVVALLTGVSGVTWQWRQAEKARRDEAEALKRERAANAAQQDAIHRLRWREMDDLIARREPSLALARAAALLRERPDDARAAMFAMSILDYHQFLVLAGPLITTPQNFMVPLRMSTDGQWVIHAAPGGMVEVFDASTGRKVSSFQQEYNAAQHLQRLLQGGGVDERTHDIDCMATGTGPWPLAVASDDGMVTLRQLPGGESVILPGTRYDTAFVDVAFSGDGRRLIGRSGRSVRSWDATKPTEEPLKITLEAGVRDASISQDGRRCLLWNAGGAVLWEATSGAVLAEVAAHAKFLDGALSADGNRFALAEQGGGVRVWDADGWKELPACDVMAGKVALNGDGTRLLAGGYSIPLSVVDVASGLTVSREMRTYKIDTGERQLLRGTAVLSSPGGDLFATAGMDEVMCLWRTEDGEPACSPVFAGQGGPGPFLQFSGDGNKILLQRWLAGYRRGDVAARHMGAETGIWKPTGVEVRDGGWATGGACTATALSADGTVGVSGWLVSGKSVIQARRLADDHVLLDRPCEGEVAVPTVSPDNLRVYAIANEDGVGRPCAWSLETGDTLWRGEPCEARCQLLALSPDGKWLACAPSLPARREGATFRAVGLLELRDAATGRVVHSQRFEEDVTSLWFAPGHAARLLVCGSGGEPTIWDAVGNELLATCRGGRQLHNCAAWSADATLVAAGGPKGVAVWEAHSGRLLAHLEHAAWVSHVEFHPDGRSLVTTCHDGSFRLWDPRTGRLLLPPQQQGTACATARFTQDGRRLVVHDTRGFRVWDAVTLLPLTVHFGARATGVDMNDCASYHAIMSPDGSLVMVGRGTDELSIREVAVPDRPAPAWFGDMVEAIALKKEGMDGAIELVSGNQIFGLRAPVDAEPADNPYAQWARRVLGWPQDTSAAR